MGLALSLVYPELISFTSGTRGWSKEYEEDGVALEEETCLLEVELLMLCWLLWEDTELGRPWWNTHTKNKKNQHTNGYKTVSQKWLPSTYPTTMTQFVIHTWWGSGTVWPATPPPCPPWDIGDTQWEGRGSCWPCPPCCACIMELALFCCCCCCCCWRRGLAEKLERRPPDWNEVGVYQERQEEEGCLLKKSMSNCIHRLSHSHGSNAHTLWPERFRWQMNVMSCCFSLNQILQVSLSVSKLLYYNCVRLPTCAYPVFKPINMKGWSDQVVHIHTQTDALTNKSTTSKNHICTDYSIQ